MGEQALKEWFQAEWWAANDKSGMRDAGILPACVGDVLKLLRRVEQLEARLAMWEGI